MCSVINSANVPLMYLQPSWFRGGRGCRVASRIPIDDCKNVGMGPCCASKGEQNGSQSVAEGTRVPGITGF